MVAHNASCLHLLVMHASPRVGFPQPLGRQPDGFGEAEHLHREVMQSSCGSVTLLDILGATSLICFVCLALRSLRCSAHMGQSCLRHVVLIQHQQHVVLLFIVAVRRQAAFKAQTARQKVDGAEVQDIALHFFRWKAKAVDPGTQSMAPVPHLIVPEAAEEGNFEAGIASIIDPGEEQHQ